MHVFSVLRSKWYAGVGINGDMRANSIEFNAWGISYEKLYWCWGPSNVASGIV